MDVFGQLRKAIADLVLVLFRLNADTRKELREVLVEFQSEMERVMTVAILHLDGIRRIKDKAELIAYLDGAESSLLHSCNQHKICAGLYELADRFKQVFDPVRGAVDLTRVASLADMIRTLAGGERSVLEGLRDTITMLHEQATDLSALSGPEYDERLTTLHQRVAMERDELRRKQKWLSDTVADVLNQM